MHLKVRVSRAGDQRACSSERILCTLGHKFLLSLLLNLEPDTVRRVSVDPARFSCKGRRTTPDTHNRYMRRPRYSSRCRDRFRSKNRFYTSALRSPACNCNNGLPCIDRGRKLEGGRHCARLSSDNPLCKRGSGNADSMLGGPRMQFVCVLVRLVYSRILRLGEGPGKPSGFVARTNLC